MLRLGRRVITDLLVIGGVLSLGALARSWAQAPVASAEAIATNWNTIALAAIGMVGTSFGVWITFQTNKIHTAVNSERTATIAEIKRLNDVVTQLATHLAVATGSTSIGQLGELAAKGGPTASKT